MREIPPLASGRTIITGPIDPTIKLQKTAGLAREAHFVYWIGLLQKNTGAIVMVWLLVGGAEKAMGVLRWVLYAFVRFMFVRRIVGLLVEVEVEVRHWPLGCFAPPSSAAREAHNYDKHPPGFKTRRFLKSYQAKEKMRLLFTHSRIR